MSSKELALPPRHLVAVIAGMTALGLATLSWLGWRLLEQDRVLEGQQAQQRIERAADLVAAALQRALAADQQRLAAGHDQWPAGAVSLLFRDGVAQAHPRERVAYLPAVPPVREAPAGAFARGEEMEFRQPDRAAAIGVFGEMANSSDPAVRSGALLRLARNLHAAGRSQEALSTYHQLSKIDGASEGGAPAGLVARYARCKLLEDEQRQTELRAEARLLDRELRSGRWPLTGPVYWLYAEDAARWSGAPFSREREEEVFAEAADALWQKWRSMPPSGQESLSIAGQALTVLWQASGGSFRALVATPRFAQSRWLAAAAPVINEQKIAWGTAGPGDRPKATRRVADTGLPWEITVVSRDTAGQAGAFAQRRQLLMAGFALLVLMTLTASYVIFRAVSSELAVARLKSDFVAAVSHEFRTPLTTLRQFTDRLREHEDLSDENRSICYEAQSRATERLTRLVESVLDFGRMEAGARIYKFERQDGTELVRRTVEDFRREAAGYEIAFRGDGAARIDADGEALSRAIRNVLDNAVKYSPDCRTIDVALERRQHGVAIAVRDRGMGIPATELAAIFSKFHRGEQALTRGIKGTGIGLAMAEQIVKAHHGHFEVRSEPGKGSTFTMVLPAKD
jgi:signal transduction histidine kinase